MIRVLSVGTRLSPTIVAVLFLVPATICRAQSPSADYFFAKALSLEMNLVEIHHRKSILFEVELSSVIPMALGVDCGVLAYVKSEYSTGDPIKYLEVVGRFTACNGVADSQPELIARSFMTVPCKPRYPEEDTIKSCGGPLDRPEANQLHMLLPIDNLALGAAFHNLQEAGVDLTLQYDVTVTTAARLLARLQDMVPGEVSSDAHERIALLTPYTPLILIRGREAKGSNRATVALIKANDGTLLDVNQDAPLGLAPPSRPNH